MVELFANTGDSDQTTHSAASDLGLYCLPVTHLGVSNLQRVNTFSLQTDIQTNAKSGDPDETAHYEPSHLDLHCLPVLVIDSKPLFAT